MKALSDLQRMRLFATGLLFLMASIFVCVTLFGLEFSWGPWVAAFSEAAMVGALADWFAVTALFRRPLGLPIPHTAVIPRNKDRIGRSLGNFIAGNFLSAEVISHRLREADPVLQGASWLSVPENARLLACRLSGIISPALAALDEDYIRTLIADSLLDKLRSVPVSPLAGQGLLSFLNSRYRERLFNSVFELCDAVLAKNRDLIRTKVTERSEWWVPAWVDERLADNIIAGFEEVVRELRDVSSPQRHALEQEMKSFALHLMESPDWRAAGESLKEEVLNDAVVKQHGIDVWKGVLDFFARDVARGADGVVGRALERALIRFALRLREDDRLRKVLNRWLERAMIRFLAERRAWIGAFFTSVVLRWDARVAVEKLEAQVGRDLQYIRINGTLVGGLVGIGLHGIKVLL